MGVTKLSENITLTIKVDNVGERSGDEVVMVFHSPVQVDVPAGLPLPKRRLLWFERLVIPSGASQVVTCVVSAAELGLVNFVGDTVVYPGAHILEVDRGHGPTLQQSVSVQSANPLVVDTLFSSAPQT